MTSDEDITTIYLIRHAQSADHEGNIRQRPTSPLGKNGKKQAKAVAKRMKREKIDIILSSKWDRAWQTAQEISQKIKVKLEVHEMLHEKLQNPILYGADMDGEVQKRYLEAVKKFGSDFNWKFEGKGESLNDLVKRIKKFQKHLLKEHMGQSVLLVSHGLYIRAFVILCLLENNYDEASFHKIFNRISTNNTGITKLEYYPAKKHWELRYLNDHLHLG